METKIRCLYGIILILLVSSCDLDDTLDRSEIAIDETYFVECYLQPNELYNLTATRVQPIFDDFILDYSLDFDVFIIGEDTTELYQSLFVDQETGFVFNYGRGVRLDPDINQVNLLVITPTADTIVASTIVPKPIVIKSAHYSERSVNTSFDLSSDSDQNYYLHIANYMTYNEDTTYHDSLLQFLDLSTQVSSGEYQAVLELDNRVDSIAVDVTLMRVTEENYKYQQSLSQAKEASDGKVTYPAPLQGNLIGAEGIFTCYQADYYTIVEN